MTGAPTRDCYGCDFPVQKTPAKEMHVELLPFLEKNTSLFMKVNMGDGEALVRLPCIVTQAVCNQQPNIEHVHKGSEFC